MNILLYIFALWIVILIIFSVFLFCFKILRHGKFHFKQKSQRESASSSQKGRAGEHAISVILGDTIPGEQYVINNLLFQTSAGRSCQIDHIYINHFAIWVIETKNYTGKIYGNNCLYEWTQFLSNRKRIKFYNPVRQNATHIYHLSRYLNSKENIFRNAVVFLENADISNVSSNCVCSIDLLPLLKNYNTDTQLSSIQMDYYYKKLLELKSRTSISEEEHVKNIYQTQELLHHGFCPRCGKTLILKRGKFGTFYSCSNYPKCKFKKSH